MEPGERVNAAQPTPLIEAANRALRLHERLISHEAELLRHVESASKTAALPNGPGASALRDGVDRVRRAVDAASHLIDGLARALTDEDDR